MNLENKFLRLELRDDMSFRLIRKNDGVFWETEASDIPSEPVFCDGSRLELRLTVTGMPPVQATAQFASDFEIDFSLRAPYDAPMPETLQWPPAWTPGDGERSIQPMGEGFSFPCDDSSLNVPEAIPFFCGLGSLAFFGLERPGACLMTGITRAMDAEMVNFRIDGRLASGPVWRNSKGKWGYDRSLRYFFTDTLSDAARLYRHWRETLGDVVTLKEKTRKLPHLERIAGAADIWIWDDNAMNRLYARPEEPEKTPRNPQKIAFEMTALGMNRVLWQAFEGETPEDCAFLKSIGFLVGKYDVYRDVIPKPDAPMIVPYRRNRSVNTKYWPDIVSIDEKGDYGLAWALHGLDGKMHCQHAVCEIPALKLTMENVPPDIQRVGYNSRFIDVQGTMPFQECYSPLHPATRSDSMRYIRHQMDFLADIGLVCGLEVGNEMLAASYHFSEGMFSACPYRAPDAGRRMTTQYQNDEIPSAVLEYLLNPAVRIPLWDLVYHDCTVNYWYWGDSSFSCPGYVRRRDLLNAVCGQPPLYSLTATQWEELKDQVAESYKRATPVAAATAFHRMTSFECLTPDRMVQKSTFANGISVIVNFTTSDYTAPDGTTVPAESFTVTAGADCAT